MAGVRFKVDTDRLAVDVDSLKADIRKIINDVNEVNQEINSIGAMWKGEANSALTQNFNEAYQWMSTVLDSFVGFSETLEKDVKEYEKCERQTSDLARSI